MKSKASGLLNRIITALTSMARAKTLALKSKTRAIKARLIIFSLLSNKKFLASSISHKLHSVLAHHRRDKLKSHNDDDGSGDEGNGDGSGSSVEEDRAVVLYRDSMAHHAVPDPMHTELVLDNITDGSSYYGYGDDDEEGQNKYPDLMHSMFDSEDLGLEEDPGGSVIELVKNSKQEAGEPFSLEEEIDHAAELFIRRFHRQMRIQKQQSFKEFQEMLQRGL